LYFFVQPYAEASTHDPDGLPKANGGPTSIAARF
jgi:hypothetical protein